MEVRKPNEPITQKDVDQLAMAIGHFIMKFELLVELLRKGIMHMCIVRKMDDWQVLEVLLADLTAEPLLKKYEAMFSYKLPILIGSEPDPTDFKNNPDARKQMKEIYDEVDDAIRHRNKVAHAFWYVTSSFNVETQSIDEHRFIGKNERVKRHSGVKNAFDHYNNDPITELNDWTKKMQNTVDKMLKLSVVISKTTPRAT